MSGYGRRRYKVEGGKLLKRWDGDHEDWHESKADAWEAVAPEKEVAAPKEAAAAPKEKADVPKKKKRRGRPPKVKPEDSGETVPAPGLAPGASVTLTREEDDSE